MRNDPFWSGLATMIVVALAGVVTFVLGCGLVGGEDAVALQLPAVVSGAFAGLLLLGTGAFLSSVMAERRARAARTLRLDDLLDEAASLVALAPELRKRIERRRRTMRKPSARRNVAPRRGRR